MRTIRIYRTKTGICAAAKSYQLEMDPVAGMGRLRTGRGKLLFELPLGMRIEATGQDIYVAPPLCAQITESTVIFRAKRPSGPLGAQELVFDFRPDTFTFHCRLTVAPRSTLAPGRIEYFRGPELGMHLNPLIEGFCSPKAPISEEDYRNLFPAASTEGLASPPVLNIGLKFHDGFVGIGLLEYSNATAFGISNPFMGLMVDALGKQVTFRAGETYTGPKVIFTFPKDGWNGIEVFRNELEKAGQIAPTPAKPDWWKRPTYCTYGDQIMAHQPVLYSDIYWDSPLYTQEWVKKAVLNAERRLGYRNFTVIIDAFWQRRWDTDPVSDPRRFPRMRQLIDELHDRGHRVLLWYSPHAADTAHGCGKIARQYGLVGRYRIRHELLHPSELSLLDYSVENAGAYVQEIAERLFGNARHGLDADGVKLDFVFALPPTEQSAPYRRPSEGMGLRMIERYLKLFSAAAKAVKSDVLLNYSASDPRVSHLFGMNRLHDTRISPLERERRARVSALASPDLVIDSDGAVMMSDWVEHTYIAAAIYGTPSLYYTEVFNDGQRWPADKMRTLGKLFSMCENRGWGRPEFVDYGGWRLRDAAGQIIGESYAGKICWLKTGPGKVNILCFEDQRAEIDLHGMTIHTITPRPRRSRWSGTRLTADWRGGVLYEGE